MINNRKITETITDLTSLDSLITAYQEVAALRMQSIRGDVLSQRIFANELSSLYSTVKGIYRHEIRKLLEKHHLKDPSMLLRKNGKSLYVLLSANTGFYGEIIQKTFNQFVTDVENLQNVEVAIVGAVGKEMLHQHGFDKSFTYFEVPDHNTENDQYAKLLSYMLTFENVFVYHGLFKSLITQDSTVTKLDSEEEIVENVGNLHVKSKWLVDPNLDKILTFFESEMISNIFYYTFDESQIAKLASRIYALEDATQNIQKSLNSTLFAAERLIHMQGNKDLLNMLSGRRLWKKRI